MFQISIVNYNTLCIVLNQVIVLNSSLHRCVSDEIIETIKRKLYNNGNSDELLQKQLTGGIKCE